MVMRCRDLLKQSTSSQLSTGNLILQSGGVVGGRGQSRTMAKVSALSLNAKKRKGKKISMVTAYDYPSAVHVARAGIDMILVGDSVAMVELGHETTQQMSTDTMIHHCQSVKRGLQLVNSGSMLVGDMPFGTYEFEDTDVALRNAYRFVKEGGCDAVKMEVRLFRIMSKIHINS
jgi:3-methyl-2-oxobutanoate hydroxymethyltransferase